MKREEFEQKVREIVAADSRYQAPAYHFVADAVSFTASRIREASPEASRHIRGQELLGGIRDYALEAFGPLTFDVLQDWGIRKTEDFGNIVFRMVDEGLLGSSSEDSPADFADGYDFHQVFLKPFLDPGNDTLPKVNTIQ